MRPATNASSSASVPCTPAHTTTTSSPASRAASTTADEVQERRDEHALAALRRRRRRRASRSSSRGSSVSADRLEVLARRVPEVESGDANGVPLAAEDALAERVAQRARLLHLGRAEHPLVARRERLADRRGRPDDVDDDSGRGRSGLVRSEHDVDTHAGTLAAVAEPLRCYRHPDRETYVSCSECGRGICPDCMTYGPVGIRCPDHASDRRARQRRRAGRRDARSRSLSLYGPIVTFDADRDQRRRLPAPAPHGRRPQRAVGLDLRARRPRLDASTRPARSSASPRASGGASITATFLHYGPLHLGMNMLVLWFIGPPLEEYFGHARYLLVYLVSGLAGSAGALIWSPNALTVGASGAILGTHGRRARPRGAPDLGLRRSGDGARRLQPRDHVRHPGDLDRRPHRRADRRRAVRARVLELQALARARDALDRRGRRR